jgi:hypothetical protein
MLTIYVPKCEAILLRGCLVSLKAEGLAAPLIVTDAGSLDRDYDGTFQITRLNGPLALYNVPLDRVEQVHGDVKIIATIEYANTGTHYEDGKRTTIIPPPRECTIDKIEGNLTAWFARANLKIGNVSGVVDVKNETGDTSWIVGDTVVDWAYRVISDTGRIDVKISKGALSKLPLMALTTEGTVTTDASQDVLEDTSFTTGEVIDGSRRDWRGVKSVRKGGPMLAFEQFERPKKALRGEERPAGIDLISRVGTVNLTVTPRK